MEESEIKEGTKRKNDIIKRLKPTLTPHYFRHNFATLLFEAGVEPLIAMKILGHTDYQTTANIYTHLNSEMMKKSSVDMKDVFRRKQEAKSAYWPRRRPRWINDPVNRCWIRACRGRESSNKKGIN